MSWPVANTLMIEPTESESLDELDRFCDALINIRKEIKSVQEGSLPRDNNMLVNAPHPLSDVVADSRNSTRSYSQYKAFFPLEYLNEDKFWPTVARVDDTYGDQNIFCTCVSDLTLAAASFQLISCIRNLSTLIQNKKFANINPRFNSFVDSRINRHLTIICKLCTYNYY